jgi:hypothetical protein
MTEKTPRVWVGDQVYDADVGKEGIVTDVAGGTYVLCPVHVWAATWTAGAAARWPPRKPWWALWLGRP